MISKPFVAATSALALLAMTGAVYAGPSSSSLSPGPNHYATIHQGARTTDAYGRTVPREHRVSAALSGLIVRLAEGE
jgi:hypothetical protein